MIRFTVVIITPEGNIVKHQTVIKTLHTVKEITEIVTLETRKKIPTKKDKRWGTK